MGEQGQQQGWDFETRAIHVGQEADPRTGAVVPAISLSTTFAQDGVGGLREGGYEYSRSGNPMRTAVETCLASLEGAAHGFSFASGLAAEDVLLRSMLRPGEGVILGNDAYGGTYRLIAKVFAPAGHPWWAFDLSRPADLAANFPKGATVIWLETPTNPLLSCFDIAAIAQVAHANGARVVVDNTFATPYLQNPLAWGADVVVHSATKYLGGHSDVVGGFVATSDEELAAQLRYLQNATGAIPSPFDLYLLLRGVKTLGVRMDRHCQNARAIVDLLVHHDAVERVLYPQLPDHLGHQAAAKQMRDFGGMVSFVVKGAGGGEHAALRLVERTKLFTLAESLGAVESLIEHPARMTHASAAGSALEVPAGLVRLSVGIESGADLVADLHDALDGLSS
jgi:cystathionine gamma-synthase